MRLQVDLFLLLPSLRIVMVAERSNVQYVHFAAVAVIISDPSSNPGNVDDQRATTNKFY